MGRSIFAVAVSTLIMSAVFANDPNKTEEEYPDAYARNAWGEISHDLSEIVDRLCKRDDLPDSSIWHPWREDRESNEHRINKLMDEALSHLKIGKLSEYRQEYAALTARIKKNRELIGQHMDKRVAAPEKTGRVSGLWTQSRDQHEKQIEELKAEIQGCETRQKEMVEEMRQEMARMGISLDEKQVENLLLHVAGDTFFDISMCFHNVKQLTDVIGGLITENETYVQNAQRYYGMYVSLVGILLYANERAQENIRTKYIPKIEDIIEKAEKMREQTRNLIKSNATDRDALTTYQKNLDVQSALLRAGDFYCKYLRDQLAKLAKTEAELQKRREVVLNTYETVDLASTMLSTMKKTINDLALIQNMQLPEMVSLETEQIRLQFEGISEQLRLMR